MLQITETPRQLAMIFAAATLFSLFLLAISVDTFQFTDSVPDPVAQDKPSDVIESATQPIQQTVGNATLYEWDLVRLAISLLVVGCIIWYILYRLGVQQTMILLLFLGSVCVLAVVGIYFAERPEPDIEDAGLMAETGAGSVAVFEPYTADWLTWATSLLISIVVAGGAYWWWRRGQSPDSEDDAIADLAAAALANLDDGILFEDVILQSYLDMQTAVRERLKLGRQASMTTREFEDFLVSHGLPADALQALTRLFERVRYGAYKVNPADKQTARTALQAIVAASRGQT